MYGKIFATAFTGSMYGAGFPVFALWAYILANCDKDGIVELNVNMLAAMLDGSRADPDESKAEVERAIDFLCAPDPRSRLSTDDGRRLIQEGSFRYRVVNHAHYRALTTEDHRRKVDAERAQRFRDRRKASQATAPSPDPPPEPSPDPPQEPVRPKKLPATIESFPANEFPDLNTPEFLAAWEDWLAYRKQRKPRVMEDGQRRALAHIASYGPHAGVCAIRQSIAQSWQGLFPEKHVRAAAAVAVGQRSDSARPKRSLDAPDCPAVLRDIREAMALGVESRYGDDGPRAVGDWLAGLDDSPAMQAVGVRARSR